MLKREMITIETEEWAITLPGDGDRFAYQDVKVELRENDGLEILVTAETSRVRTVGVRFMKEWKPGTRFLGDEFERSYGTLQWAGVDFHRIMCWYFAASNSEGTEAFGVKTRPNALCFFTTDNEGATLWLDLRCGGTGVDLKGRTLNAATFVHDEATPGEDAFTFLHRYCTELNDRVLPLPRPVYGSNNWYYAYGNSSAEEIINDTKMLAELTKGLPNRPYMVIDDCWQMLARTGVSAQGRPMAQGNELFPDMKGLADEMKAMDVHPGIWYRPLRSQEKFIDRSLFGQLESDKLDPSHPEVLAMVAEDTSRLTKTWGYELIKYDFVTRDTLGIYVGGADELFHSRRWSFFDTGRTTAEILKSLYQTIYDNSNGAVIIGCNVIGHLAAGLIHLHRSGDDTSGRLHARTIRYGVNALAFRYPQHKAFFDIDADCVCITNAIPKVNNKDVIDLYANSGTPLFASMDPKAMDEDMMDFMRKAFVPASEQRDRIIPLDWFDTTVPGKYLINGELREYRWMKNYFMTSPITS